MSNAGAAIGVDTAAVTEQSPPERASGRCVLAQALAMSSIARLASAATAATAAVRRRWTSAVELLADSHLYVSGFC